MHPTVVAAETFAGEPLLLERLADEGAALDAVSAALDAAGVARDDPRREELCPYFGTLWPAARAVGARVVALGREGLAGRRVLELGCGLAAPALLAARLGADVVASDYHPDVAALLARNAARNGVRVEYRPVDWRREADLPAEFDLVLAADVLYLPQHPPLVARAIARALDPGGRALVGDPARAGLQAFVDALPPLGLSAAIEVARVDDPPRGRRDVFVVEVRRESR
jgi:predicted nicotinamide N-methyase